MPHPKVVSRRVRIARTLKAVTNKNKAKMLLLAAAALMFWTIVAWRGLSTVGPNQLRVFGSFWSSGWAVAHHLNPYAVYPLSWHIPLHDARHGYALVDLNLSPPSLLPLFHVLSFLAPDTAVKLWTLASAAAVFTCIALVILSPGVEVQRRQLLWLLICPALYDTLLVAEDWTFLALAATLAWFLINRNRQIAAGVFLGILVAIKPNYALWPLFLLIAGHKRTAATTALVTTVLCMVPVLLYDPAVYPQWLHAISGDQHWTFPTDVSISAFATIFGHPAVGQAVSASLVLFSCWFIFRNRPSTDAIAGIALSVAMLASPIAWMHYTLLLIPVLLSRPWDRRMTAAALLLILPTHFAMILMRVPDAAMAARCCYLLAICYFALRFFTDGLTEIKEHNDTEKANSRLMAEAATS